MSRNPEPLPRVTHGAPDRPLPISGIDIPCYVLNTGQRVLSRKGMINALGMVRGGHVQKGSDRLARFVGGERLKPFITEDILGATANPIRFRLTPNGQILYGYEAELLVKICRAVWQAKEAGRLQKQQMHVAQRCEALILAVAVVGITALVDEVTGFQADRPAYELRKILNRYLAPELQPWAKTFEDDFYQHIYRLKGWPFTFNGANRPQLVGKITNDIVYERLPQGLLEILQVLNPLDSSGRRPNKHHQLLSEDFGRIHLKSHLRFITGLMKNSSSWEHFIFKLDQAFPRQNMTPNIPGLDFDF